jgi:hypothetical protein
LVALLGLSKTFTEVTEIAVMLSPAGGGTHGCDDELKQQSVGWCQLLTRNLIAY